MTHYSWFMAARENLIPTLTVDRNGKQTTVYRKASAAAQAKGVPRVVAPWDAAARRGELITILVDRWQPSHYNSDKRHDLARNLRQYSGELLERLEGMQDSDKTAQLVRRSVGNGYPESEVREELCFFPHLEFATYYLSRRMVLALHEYPHLLTSEDFSQEDERTQSQCKALLRLTEVFVNDGEEQCFRDDDMVTFALKDDQLVGFVINNHDNLDRIIGFIRERVRSGATTVDVALLEGLLTSRTAAMDSGVL